MPNQYEREAADLENRLESGEISVQEFNKSMRELERDEREAIEERAQQAYDAVIGGGW